MACLSLVLSFIFRPHILTSLDLAKSGLSPLFEGTLAWTWLAATVEFIQGEALGVEDKFQ